MTYRPQRSRPCRGVTRIDARPTLVFVTVGTALRVPWLANDEVHSALRDIWFKADRWETGIYVIMPDHIHLFAWPGKIEHDLDAWIRYWSRLQPNVLEVRLVLGSNVLSITQSGRSKARRRSEITFCRTRSAAAFCRNLRIGRIKARFFGTRNGGRSPKTDERELVPSVSFNPDPDAITPKPSHGPVAEA